MSWDHEVDVVVLGSGGAGLTAALTAAVAGASGQGYEKAPTVGGTPPGSGGIVWMPAHNPCPDGELKAADALKYLRAQSLGAMDTPVVARVVGPRHASPMLARSAPCAIAIRSPSPVLLGGETAPCMGPRGNACTRTGSHSKPLVPRSPLRRA